MGIFLTLFRLHIDKIKKKRINKLGKIAQKLISIKLNKFTIKLLPYQIFTKLNENNSEEKMHMMMDKGIIKGNLKKASNAGQRN